MKTRIFQVLSILTVVSALLFSCTPGVEDQSEQRPNLVWINVEDIGPALGAYGDSLATTPHLDRLAQMGVTYNHAYASAPICAPSRSCFITGVYATSLGTQHLRSDIELPDEIKPLPVLLKETGYFTTNYGKTDWNFSPEGAFDYWQQEFAPWRQRPDNVPFFSMFVIGGTHEGSANSQKKYEESVEALPANMFHNPKGFPVPPYYPNTPEYQRMWAQYYDVISAMDLKVGTIMRNLEDDGLMENTIIFFFSDHGFGLPRYKRWLYKTGVHVPLIVYVPDKYKDWQPESTGVRSDRMVSFVDFTPTALALTGSAIPDYIQGAAFLGEAPTAPRQRVYCARSRADDMYEVSRMVLDRDYVYIRHYLPHLPYIQSGYIFSDRKWSFRELRKDYEAGNLSGEALEMWGEKPAEEFYVLSNDPDELDNRIGDPQYAGVVSQMRKQLQQWILDTRDAGMLLEPEMMMRSLGSTPYTYAQSEAYDLPTILAAAEKVGNASLEEHLEGLTDDDSGVRFWNLIGLMQFEKHDAGTLDAVSQLLEDPSPTVQITAAELLCRENQCENARDILERWVMDDRAWLALYAGRALQRIGEQACPSIPVMRKVIDKYKAPPGSERRFKDGNFAAFISWAVGIPLENCTGDTLLYYGN